MWWFIVDLTRILVVSRVSFKMYRGDLHTVTGGLYTYIICHLINLQLELTSHDKRNIAKREGPPCGQLHNICATLRA
jgi:hypothetical protein